MQIVVNDLHGTPHPVFRSYLRSQRRHTGLHGHIGHSRRDCLSQLLRGKAFIMWHLWPSPQLHHHLLPEELVGHEGRDNGRSASPQSGGGGARSAMMYHRRYPWKEPAMWQRVGPIDVFGWLRNNRGEMPSAPPAAARPSIGRGARMPARVAPAPPGRRSALAAPPPWPPCTRPGRLSYSRRRR